MDLALAFVSFIRFVDAKQQIPGVCFSTSIPKNICEAKKKEKEVWSI